MYFMPCFAQHSKYFSVCRLCLSRPGRNIRRSPAAALKLRRSQDVSRIGVVMIPHVNSSGLSTTVALSIRLMRSTTLSSLHSSSMTSSSFAFTQSLSFSANH